MHSPDQQTAARQNSNN